MGYVGNEFLSHLVDPCLLLNILLKLVIDRFQLTDGLPETHGQRIHVLSQDPDLCILPFFRFIPGVKIQLGHFFRKTGKLVNGAREPSCHKIDHDPADQYGKDAHIGQKPVGEHGTLADTGKRGAHNESCAVIRKKAPAFQIAAVSPRVEGDLERIGFILLQHLYVHMVFSKNIPLHPVP